MPATSRPLLDRSPSHWMRCSGTSTPRRTMRLSALQRPSIRGAVRRLRILRRNEPLVVDTASRLTAFAFAEWNFDFLGIRIAVRLRRPNKRCAHALIAVIIDDARDMVPDLIHVQTEIQDLTIRFLSRFSAGWRSRCCCDWRVPMPRWRRV